MATILLLSVDRTLAATIGEAVGERARVELVQTIEPEALEGVGLIVIDRAAIAPEKSLGVAIGAVTDAAQGWPVILATDEQDSGEILKAVRAGAIDVIGRSATVREISEVLSRLLNSVLIETGRGSQFTLVLGVDGEASSIAATDLALLRCKTRASVLLIDCSLPNSACETYLDMKAGYGIASAIADIERLDSSLLSSAVARHGPSNLMLLTLDGGTGAEPAGIAPGDFVALVRLLRTCCSDVILAAGSLRHAGLLRELGSLADRVELVCRQSIRELEASRQLLERIGPDTPTMERMRLLIWDHLPAVLLDGRRMAEVLDIGPVLGIPLDRAHGLNALNGGHPMSLDADARSYGQAMRRVAGIPEPARVPLLKWPAWTVRLPWRRP